MQQALDRVLLVLPQPSGKLGEGRQDVASCRTVAVVVLKNAHGEARNGEIRRGEAGDGESGSERGREAEREIERLRD